MFAVGPTSASGSPSLRELYPVGKAIETGNLKVSEIHTVHYQIYGNPAGQPALVVHGGPGAGCYANHAYVHIILHVRIFLQIHIFLLQTRIFLQMQAIQWVPPISHMCTYLGSLKPEL